MSTPLSTSIKNKATRVAGIFDLLATIVLVLGGIGVVVAGGFGVIGLFTANSFGQGLGMLFFTLVYAAAVAIYTALTWAGITLATIVAGYIAERTGSAEPAVQTHGG